ncbi:uncharacterized protein [Ptychodera flava]|uniref:uncharacterized protein n=1 Tax=Ptychodera flava TaxID=63121 RepID=UPI00396A7A94
MADKKNTPAGKTVAKRKTKSPNAFQNFFGNLKYGHKTYKKKQEEIVPEKKTRKPAAKGANRSIVTSPKSKSDPKPASERKQQTENKGKVTSRDKNTTQQERPKEKPPEIPTVGKSEDEKPDAQEKTRTTSKEKESPKHDEFHADNNNEKLIRTTESGKKSSDEVPEIKLSPAKTDVEEILSSEELTATSSPNLQVRYRPPNRYRRSGSFGGYSRNAGLIVASGGSDGALSSQRQAPSTDPTARKMLWTESKLKRYTGKSPNWARKPIKPSHGKKLKGSGGIMKSKFFTNLLVSETPDDDSDTDTNESKNTKSEDSIDTDASVGGSAGQVVAVTCLNETGDNDKAIDHLPEASIHEQGSPGVKGEVSDSDSVDHAETSDRKPTEECESDDKGNDITGKTALRSHSGESTPDKTWEEVDDVSAPESSDTREGDSTENKDSGVTESIERKGSFEQLVIESLEEFAAIDAEVSNEKQSEPGTTDVLNEDSNNADQLLEESNSNLTPVDVLKESEQTGDTGTYSSSSTLLSGDSQAKMEQQDALSDGEVFFEDSTKVEDVNQSKEDLSTELLKMWRTKVSETKYGGSEGSETSCSESESEEEIVKNITHNLSNGAEVPYIEGADVPADKASESNTAGGLNEDKEENKDVESDREENMESQRAKIINVKVPPPRPAPLYLPHLDHLEQEETFASVSGYGSPRGVMQYMPSVRRMTMSYRRSLSSKSKSSVSSRSETTESSNNNRQGEEFPDTPYTFGSASAYSADNELSCASVTPGSSSVFFGYPQLRNHSRSWDTFTSHSEYSIPESLNVESFAENAVPTPPASETMEPSIASENASHRTESSCGESTNAETAETIESSTVASDLSVEIVSARDEIITEYKEITNIMRKATRILEEVLPKAEHHFSENKEYIDILRTQKQAALLINEMLDNEQDLVSLQDFKALLKLTLLATNVLIEDKASVPADTDGSRVYMEILQLLIIATETLQSGLDICLKSSKKCESSISLDAQSH